MRIESLGTGQSYECPDKSTKERIGEKEIIVIKVGGSAGIDLDSVCCNLAELHHLGIGLVLVHGGSHETDLLSEKLGKPPRFVTSVSGVESRYTDRETLEIFSMACAGKVNKDIVERLQKLGVNAVGLSGLDGRLLEGKRKEAIRIIENGKMKILRGDYTGRVERVNTRLVRLLIENGFLPVIAPLAISFEGEAINVDGDRAAAMVATALGASTLLLLSNVPGLLRDIQDPESLIPSLDQSEVDRAMGFAQGRMVKKVIGAKEALEGGVHRVIIGDGRCSSCPISRALNGEGTVISRTKN